MCDVGLGVEIGMKTVTLSERELEVLILILRGCSNKEISARLCVSLKTVEHHLSSIYRKVGVQSRVELVSLFLKEVLGLLKTWGKSPIEKRTAFGILVCDGTGLFLKKEGVIRIPVY